MNGELAGVVDGDSAPGAEILVKHNSEISWSEWKPADYYQKNYVRLLPEDAQIITCASTFLSANFHLRAPAENAFDVGAGTNLYPALLMLPWARRITLTDHAEPNVRWLAESARDLSSPWRW